MLLNMSVPPSTADEQCSTSCNNIIPANSGLNLENFYINGSHLNSSVNLTGHDENSPSKHNLKSEFHDYYGIMSEDLRHFSHLPYHIRGVMPENELNELVLNIFHTESFSKQRPNIEQDSSLRILLLNIVKSVFYTASSVSR